MSDEFFKRQFVYLGQRTGKSDQCAVIRIVLNDEIVSDEIWYKYDRDWAKKVVGGIYDGAEFNEKQVRGFKAAHYVRRWGKSQDLIDWVARDQKAEADKRSEKLQADARRVSEIDKIMLPLRQQYAALSKKYDSAGMRALQSAVMQSLIEAPRKSEMSE